MQAKQYMVDYATYDLGDGIKCEGHIIRDIHSPPVPLFIDGVHQDQMNVGQTVLLMDSTMPEMMGIFKIVRLYDNKKGKPFKLERMPIKRGKSKSAMVLRGEENRGTYLCTNAGGVLSIKRIESGGLAVEEVAIGRISRSGSGSRIVVVSDSRGAISPSRRGSSQRPASGQFAAVMPVRHGEAKSVEYTDEVIDKVLASTQPANPLADLDEVDAQKQLHAELKEAIAAIAAETAASDEVNSQSAGPTVEEPVVDKVEEPIAAEPEVAVAEPEVIAEPVVAGPTAEELQASALKLEEEKNAQDARNQEIATALASAEAQLAALKERQAEQQRLSELLVQRKKEMEAIQAVLQETQEIEEMKLQLERMTTSLRNTAERANKIIVESTAAVQQHLGKPEKKVKSKKSKSVKPTVADAPTIAEVPAEVVATVTETPVVDKVNEPVAEAAVEVAAEVSAEVAAEVSAEVAAPADHSASDNVDVVEEAAAAETPAADSVSSVGVLKFVDSITSNAAEIGNSGLFSFDLVEGDQTFADVVGGRVRIITPGKYGISLSTSTQNCKAILKVGDVMLPCTSHTGHSADIDSTTSIIVKYCKSANQRGAPKITSETVLLIERLGDL